jgi:hypothetical protein
VIFESRQIKNTVGNHRKFGGKMLEKRPVLAFSPMKQRIRDDKKAKFCRCGFSSCGKGGWIGMETDVPKCGVLCGKF